MAARLPVVISQSIRREASASACEEKLITELLFTPGLDATLIGPVESIEAGRTDHLCLEGLKGPFALLGWTSIADCHRQLSRLEIHGSLFDRDDKMSTALMIQTEKPADVSRRIDYFQLRTGLEPKYWVELLKQILESRDVKAFQIQMPIKSSVPLLSPNKTIKHSEKRADKIVDATGSQTKEMVYSKTIDLDRDQEAWEHLDSLMDDLDRADV